MKGLQLYFQKVYQAGITWAGALAGQWECYSWPPSHILVAVLGTV